MQNENKNSTRVDPHNPDKRGESGAINKLTENEDENADDRCGCGSSQSTSPAGQEQPFEEGERRQTMIRKANPTVATEEGQNVLSQNRPAQTDEFSHNPNKADQAKGAQNEPGREMNEIEDETASQYRRPSNGNRESGQNVQYQPRSQRQLGDPQDEESTETRRKESIAEDEEKSKGLAGQK